MTSGRLIQLHRGVYLAGTVAPEHAHEMAALLAYRLRATLSHRTAAHLWNLLPYPATAQVWVTVAPEVSAGRPRINVSRARLERRDIRRRHRHGADQPAADDPRLRGAPHRPLRARAHGRRGDFRGRASEAELRDQLARNPRKRGARALRASSTCPAARGGRARRASGRCSACFANAGSTATRRTRRSPASRSTSSGATARLAVEVDGFDAHSGRVAFERDRLKVAKLKAAGISVMPVTGRQVKRPTRMESGAERPDRLRSGLALADEECRLARRDEAARGVGPEGRAGRREVERAELVAVEEAVGAGRLSLAAALQLPLREANRP